MSRGLGARLGGRRPGPRRGALCAQRLVRGPVWVFDSGQARGRGVWGGLAYIRQIGSCEDHLPEAHVDELLHLVGRLVGLYAGGGSYFEGMDDSLEVPRSLAEGSDELGALGIRSDGDEEFRQVGSFYRSLRRDFGNSWHPAFRTRHRQLSKVEVGPSDLVG